MHSMHAYSYIYVICIYGITDHIRSYILTGYRIYSIQGIGVIVFIKQVPLQRKPIIVFTGWMSDVINAHSYQIYIFEQHLLNNSI